MNQLVSYLRLSLFLVVLASIPVLRSHVSAQPSNGQAATRRILSDRICGYKPITGFGASSIGSNEQAKAILNEVIKAAGVKPKTIGILPAEVDNAYACENDEGNGKFKRYILYNPEWLNQLIAEVGTDWTARAILAHEVGHHKKGHNLRDLRDQSGCAADLEAEADEVAGEALARLGASLEEAQTPFARISQDKGDQCYPSRAERVAAVRRGWIKVKGDPYPNAVKKFYFYYQFENWLPKGANTSNAVQGGEENGRPLYVCRATYKNGTHPGKVVAGNCNIGWGGQEIVLPNYEILIGTGTWGTPHANYRGAFEGGKADGRPLYVCRAQYNGVSHPGKVVADKCNIGYGGVEKPVPTFEVLYYKPAGSNHFWNKVNDSTWTETFSTNGGEAQIEEIGRITVEGDAGALVRHKTKTYLEYFIPDKGSKTLWLRDRANGGPWAFLGEMKGVK